MFFYWILLYFDKFIQSFLFQNYINIYFFYVYVLFFCEVGIIFVFNDEEIQVYRCEIVYGYIVSK